MPDWCIISSCIFYSINDINRLGLYLEATNNRTFTNGNLIPYKTTTSLVAKYRSSNVRKIQARYKRIGVINNMMQLMLYLVQFIPCHYMGIAQGCYDNPNV